MPYSSWFRVFLVSWAPAQNSNFHNAPASAKALKNPYEGQPTPRAKTLFHLRCARCHGENGEGSGNIPALKAEKIKEVTTGEIFWFITKGDINNGMPSWATLPKQQRWQIVSYVQSFGQPQSTQASSAPEAPMAAAKLNAPPPKPPFTDFRYEKPGEIRKITVKISRAIRDCISRQQPQGCGASGRRMAAGPSRLQSGAIRERAR